MDAGDTSIQHLKMLLEIAEDLAKEAISLYAHEYHSLSFGSFSVEFGQPHYTVLYQWGGKESNLSVSFAELTSQSRRGEWTHDENISVSANDVYAAIASNVLKMFAA